MTKIKAIILLTVFIDVIGIGIVIPILPFYVARFSDSALVITSLFAVFALCSFFSAPVIGALSDRVGRRPMLIMSIFSTSIGWFVFAGAPNLFFLFLGRVIDGIMAGNFPIAQSYFSDIAKDEKERTENLGLIGAVFGIGFIFGPLLGGVLGHFGHSVPFWCVGFLALFNGVLALFILPETHKPTEVRRISLNPFSPLIGAAKNISLRSNYLAWFLFGLAIASQQSIFSLYLRDAYKFNELAIGIIFGVTGIVISINQGFAMKHIWLKHFKEPSLELSLLLVFTFGTLILGIKALFVLCIALLMTTFGQSILRVVMTSQVVSKADLSRRGEALGVLASIASLSMVIGPFVAGFLYEKNNIAPFVFGSICLFLAFIVLYLKRRDLEKIKLEENIVMETAI